MNHEKRIQNAVCYIQNHLADNFTTRQVADYACLSYSRFLHVFTHYRQEPFWQYVKRYRLEQAAGLVRFSSYTAGEIGERCGYATKASFAKAFNDHFSCTTRTFRTTAFLPHEQHTLSVVQSLAAAIPELPATVTEAEWIRLPDLMLYYFIPPSLSANEAAFISSLNSWRSQLIPWTAKGPGQFAHIVTGTMDSVPATPYHRLTAYFGVVVSKYDACLNTRLQTSGAFLSRKLSGGKYLRLRLPYAFRIMSPVCYNFIRNNCREGNFSLRENQFFISMTGENKCELYVPVI